MISLFLGDMEWINLAANADDRHDMQAASFYTVDIEKHSMGVGLRCWPTNQDYNNGKDCSASIATYANEAAGTGEAEVHCSADSLHKGGTAAIAAAADSESPHEEPHCGAPPQVLPLSTLCDAISADKRLKSSSLSLLTFKVMS